jgi:hypothetical protein
VQPEIDVGPGDIQPVKQRVRKRGAGTQALPIDTTKTGMPRVDSAPVKDGLTSPANAEDTRTANTKDVPTSRASEPPKAYPKERHPPG